MSFSKVREQGHRLHCLEYQHEILLVACLDVQGFLKVRHKIHISLRNYILRKLLNH